jgi:hypothetical protein
MFECHSGMVRKDQTRNLEMRIKVSGSPLRGAPE